MYSILIKKDNKNYQYALDSEGEVFFRNTGRSPSKAYGAHAGLSDRKAQRGA